MFTEALKWTFKIVIGEVKKEFNIHFDKDTPLQVIEQIAMQMIAHCAKIKEVQAAMKAEADAEKPPVEVEQPKSE